MEKGGDGFVPVSVYRFSMQDLQTSIGSNLRRSMQTDDERRTKDIQATKNDKVRLIIDKSHVQSEITSTFDSVIYLVAE